jgi:hydroxyacylglutathione hydrolase
LPIYGDGIVDQTPGVTHCVGDGDVIHVGNLTIRVIQTPCHTRGSLCYYVTTTAEDHPGALFTGDTLFVGGIGAFFEGNSEAMVTIFQRLVEAIPNNTLVYCGHDYAMNFLPNALSRDPSNERLAARLSWAQEHRDNGTPAMPSTFEEELQTNLFLRVVSHTAEMGQLYPQWDPQAEKPLASLMSFVYDTV